MAVCPKGALFDRRPKPYAWNAALGGKTLADLAAMPEPQPVLACPYHGPPSHDDDLVLYTTGLVRAAEEGPEAEVHLWTRHDVRQEHRGPGRGRRALPGREAEVGRVSGRGNRKEGVGV